MRVLQASLPLSLVLLSGISAGASRLVTADQLEQAVTAMRAQSDDKAAREIGELELTERLNRPRLQKLENEALGEMSKRALALVAAVGEFQAPPAAEIPAGPAPDLAEQRRIMAAVVNYVTGAVPQLPKFFATRVTTHYEDTPQTYKNEGLVAVPHQGLHETGASSAEVSYDNGREVVETKVATTSGFQAGTSGLSTWGVFGSILSTVLLDAARSQLSWSRWEQEDTERLAVFAFAVPEEKSHYNVVFCCEEDSEHTHLITMKRTAGYHGEMAVDSATGAMLRLTIRADLKGGPMQRADVLVDYGAVTIGGRVYICPLRSLALSRAPMARNVSSVVTMGHEDPGHDTHTVLLPTTMLQLGPEQTMLNEVVFKDYHMFRAEARVVSSKDAEEAEKTNGNVRAPDAEAASQTKQPEAAPLVQVAKGNIPIAATLEPAKAESKSDVPAATAPLASVANAEPEISVTAVKDVPDEPAIPSAAPDTLRTTARLVDVSLVALDRKGRPVMDLKEGDVEIFDNGKPVMPRSFVQASGQAAAERAIPEKTDDGEIEVNNRQATGAAQQSNSAMVLMVDSANLAWADLSYARKEMLRFLKAAPEGDRIGFYAMGMDGFDPVLEPTTDHAAVAKAVTQWMPKAQDLAQAQDEEERNRQQIDQVHSICDLTHVNGNSTDDFETFNTGAKQTQAMGGPSCIGMPTDVQLRSLGSNPGRDALLVLAEVAGHLSKTGGHTNLVWISSDNALADFRSQAATKEDGGSKFLAPLAMRAQEDLNEAHVSLYPLDASQLEAGGVGAEMESMNVGVVGKSDRDSGTAVMGDAAPAMKPGRLTESMKLNEHSIDVEFRDLAAATGGRALRRAGDIAAELNGVADDGRAAYMLTFTPEGAPDDAYHRIELTAPVRKDVRLRYRSGYFYAKEPASLKERFRSAVWNAMDTNEIGVSAEANRSGGTVKLRLKVDANDVRMVEQGGRWVDSVDFFVVERNEAANRASGAGQRMTLRLKAGSYEKVLRDGITWQEETRAGMDAGVLRVLVVDENSGRLGSVTISMQELR